MNVIIICKSEKDPIKNNREKVATTFFQIIKLSVAMETSGQIWQNFELIQAFSIFSLPASMKRIR